MLYATSTSVRVSAFYMSGLTGKTGLTVKVAVSLNGTVISGLAVSDAVAATEIDSTNQPGVYSYTLDSSKTATEGQYLFHFYTTDTTVNAQHLESVIYCFAWIGYVNGAGGNLQPASNFPANFSTLTIANNAVASNVTRWNGTAVATPATAGVAEVNVKNINNVAASSVTTVNANVGTTQPTNFTGTGASALVKSDAVDIAGSAVNTASAQVGVSVVSYASGQAPLQPTTAGRTLDVSTGGEAGLDWANIGTPTTTVDLSGTTIKNVDNAIANVTTVGSVTGNVGGNVTGSVGSVVATVNASVTSIADNAITAASLASDAVGEIAAGVLDRLNSAVTTAGSWAKYVKDSLATLLAGGGSVDVASFSGDAADEIDNITTHVNLLGSGNVVVTSGVIGNVAVEVAQGSDNYHSDGLALTFVLSGWPDITGGSVLVEVPTLSFSIVGTITASDTFYIEPHRPETTAMPLTTAVMKITTTLANGHVLKPIYGTWSVTP